MTATQKIYAILSAAAGVTALVPAARIKPAGDWQNLAKPYLVQFPVPGSEFTRTYDGPKALRFSQHQVSIFADLESTAETIAAAVVAALNGYNDADVSLIQATDSFSAPDHYDTDFKVAHFVVTLEIAGALT